MEAKRCKYTRISDENFEVEDAYNTVIIEEDEEEDEEGELHADADLVVEEGEEGDEEAEYVYEYPDGDDGDIVTYEEDGNNEYSPNGDELIVDEHGQPVSWHELVTGGTVEEVETIEMADGTQAICTIVQEGDEYILEEEQDQEQPNYITEVSAEYRVTTSTAPNSATKNNFLCPHCGNGYSAAGSLKLHVRACTRQRRETDPSERTCTVCHKIFNSASYLKEHMLRHTGDQPFRCTRCYRKFLDKSKYEAHKAAHENQDRLEREANELAKETGSANKMVLKEFCCSFCNEAFTVAFQIGEVKRRYACDACREKYSNPEALKQFKQKANEKREFRCDRCQRKFVFEGFLQRHKPTCDGSIKRRRDIK